MRWFRGIKDKYDPFEPVRNEFEHVDIRNKRLAEKLEEVQTNARDRKFEEYRELCTAFAYLQNRITAIERRLDMHTNDPQPGLHIGPEKWLTFGQSPYPVEDVY